MALDNGLSAVGDRRREDLLEELALLKNDNRAGARNECSQQWCIQEFIRGRRSQKMIKIFQIRLNSNTKDS